jgi:NADPH:quinone reductase-like Zn-dependent oxidoreductase
VIWSFQKASNNEAPSNCRKYQYREIPKWGDDRRFWRGLEIETHEQLLTGNLLVGMYPFAQEDGVVPGSDGAGEVIAVGSKVTRFQKGAKVLTLFNQSHLGGSLDPQTVTSGLGGVIDGTLRQYGTFNENGLVHMPESLNWLEASTLSCAALTAWNSLYGLKPLKPGQVVLTQGTGGVSIFALQFAKAAGAIVISTTSSAKKAETLKKLGADHVINYKDEPEWGSKARELTPGKEGVDHILEVGGPTTMKQSLNAVKIDGVISIIGFLGGVKSEEQPSFLDALNHICTVRGILVGNRVQFEEMVRIGTSRNIDIGS